MVVYEGIEGAGRDVRAHAFAVVGNLDDDEVAALAVLAGRVVVAVDVATANGEVPAARHGVLGVQRQIQNGVLQLSGIGDGGPEGGGTFDVDIDGLPEGAAEQGVHRGDDLVRIDTARVELLSA